MQHSYRALPRWTRVAVVLSVFVVLVGASWAKGLPLAKATNYYNCIDHCVARQFWPGSNYGTFTDMTTPELHCNGSACYNGGQVGFIAYAQWTYDTNGHDGACVDDASGPSDVCWIENGVSTQNFGTNSSEWYYWADNRPGQFCIICKGSYNIHYIGTVPTSDYGQSHFWNINRISGTTDQWQVYGPGFNATSTSNPISPNQIYLGIELAGPNATVTGAYGGYADYTLTEWVDSSSNYHYQGCGLSGAGLQFFSGAPPPYIQYVVDPCNSSTGGDIQGWCCDIFGPGTMPARNPAVVTRPAAAAPANAGGLGIPAISPRTVVTSSDTPAYTATDVAQFARTHGVFHAVTSGQSTVASVQFMTALAASKMLKGEPVGLADGALVSVAEVHGVFTIHNLLTTGTAHRVFEVFDGHTGNLLMVSVID